MPSADQETALTMETGPPPRRTGFGRVRLHVQRTLGVLDQLVGGLATIALIALILIVLANVIGRYGFNNAVTWAAEAAQWLFIGVIFLAIPLAHRSRTHLSISFLVQALPAPLRVTADLLADLIVAYATVMLLFGGAHLIEAVVPEALNRTKRRLLPWLLRSLPGMPRPMARALKRRLAP